MPLHSASQTQTRLPQGLQLRPVQPTDLSAIAAIYQHHVTHGSGSFETEPPSLGEMTRRHAALVGQGYPYLGVYSEGTLVGYAYAGAYRSRAAYRDTVEDSVYVHPDRVGQGIGATLLAALIDAATMAGFRQMVAVVGDSANHGSVRLHERLGFRLVGTLGNVGYKHGRWLDTVLLQRELGDSARTPPSRAP